MLSDVGAAETEEIALALQKDGKIVMGGARDTGGSTDFLLARYQKNGQADSSFGDHGRVSTDLGGRDNVTALAVAKDGKIVAAGQVRVNGTPRQVGVARYLAK